MLSLHEPSLTKQDEEFIVDAIRSGWVSTGGPYVDRFEKEFAAYVGAPYAISVANGTLGLQLSIECLKRMLKCHEVFHIFAPTLTFAATWNSVFHAGGVPILIDVKTDTLNFSIDDLKQYFLDFYKYDGASKAWRHKKNGVRLLAAMPAHIMGWTPEMEKISVFCAEREIPIIEDAAESLGAHCSEGRHVGLDGLASIFSFNGNKILTTGGGGMIVTRDQAFAKLAKHLSTTAKIDTLRYDHDQSGYNYRLVNILAALGCSQMLSLPGNLVKKRQIFDWYSRGFEVEPSVRVHVEDTCVSNNWIVNIRFGSEKMRESALSALLNANIQCRPLWKPGHRVSFVNECQPVEREFKNADTMWNQMLSLPSSAHLSENEVNFVVSVVKKAICT